MGSVHHNSPMLAKTSAFLIWAAVAGAAVFWGLHLSGSAPEAPAHAQPAPVATVVRSDLGRLLGPDPASPSAESQAPLAVAQQSRFQLLGVIAAGSGGSAGWATLAVDGKPPRTFRVGSAVDGSSVLQKVSARGVEIGPRGGAPVVTLQLSPLAPAATGRPGGAGPAPAALSTGAAIGAVPGAVPGAAPGAVPGAEVPPPSEALRRPSPINR
jgi:general secretion pathway protein C